MKQQKIPMNILINTFVGMIILLHLYFMVLEMYLWSTPFGLRAFGQTLEQAKASSVLAANQGLYNGFLAAGLIWSLLHPLPAISKQLKFFFLICIVIAGCYGGFSLNHQVFLIQALPAIFSLFCIHITSVKRPNA